MFNIRKISTLFVIAIIGLSAACGFLDQTAEANKLVAEANKMIMEDNMTAISANAQLRRVFGTDLTTAKNLDAYKQENKATFDELMDKFTKFEKSQEAIADKFRQASQFKLNEKYKQYLELKTQEFSKNAESAKLVTPLIKSFIETKDEDKINALLDDYNTKYLTLTKEMQAFQEQSTQIIKDNPTLIK